MRMIDNKPVPPKYIKSTDTHTNVASLQFNEHTNTFRLKGKSYEALYKSILSVNSELPPEALELGITYHGIDNVIGVLDGTVTYYKRDKDKYANRQIAKTEEWLDGIQQKTLPAIQIIKEG